LLRIDWHFFQQLSVTLLQTPLPNVALIPFCLIFSGISTHYTGKLLGRWLPGDETSAITEDDFIGAMAIITGHSAAPQRPCEGKFKDKFGQVHYLLLEPEEGKPLNAVIRFSLFVGCPPAVIWRS
jgi:hypothetical protein